MLQTKASHLYCPESLQLLFPGGASCQKHFFIFIAHAGSNVEKRAIDVGLFSELAVGITITKQNLLVVPKGIDFVLGIKYRPSAWAMGIFNIWPSAIEVVIAVL